MESGSERGIPQGTAEALKRIEAAQERDVAEQAAGDLAGLLARLTDGQRTA